MNDKISIYLTEDHRHCDMLLAQAEELIADENWIAGIRAVEEFITAMFHHLLREEDILFPAYEKCTNTTDGPTQAMRLEHTQMKLLMEQVSSAAKESNSKRFFGLSDTLMIYIQQHNSKEEQMLYQLADEELSDISASIVEQMREI